MKPSRPTRSREDRGYIIALIMLGVTYVLLKIAQAKGYLSYEHL
jgi:hypothetical protein